nr:reverse transcriptase domain-containing protein [Tanacetum cinerariifolium]
PIPPASIAPAGEHVALEILAAHNAWNKGSKEIAGLMLMTMEPDMGKTVNELHAMLKLHEQTLPKTTLLLLMLFKLVKFRKVISTRNCNPKWLLGERIMGTGKIRKLMLPRPRSCQDKEQATSSPSQTTSVKHKHKVFENFKVFQKEIENQLGKTIKSLRFDHGGEYMSQEFLDHLKDHGIIAHRTPPYTPQHNGDDFLTKARESNLYTISISDMAASLPNTLRRGPETSINSAAQQVHNHEDSPLTSSIIIEEHEAPPIVTTSEEQTSPISLHEADEFNQEDSVDFDGNMTKAHPLEQVIGDPSKPVMTRQRLHADYECMHTHFKFYLNNSNATIPRRSNRRRVPNIVEPEIRTIEEIVPMADRTMEELPQEPTEGYGEAIVILEILAKIFEIKTNLLQLIQTNKFHGFERDNPHTHISNFKRMTATLKYKDVLNDAIKLMLFPVFIRGGCQNLTTHLKNEISYFTKRFEETFREAWERFKEMLRACPHHGFSEFTQIDTFYNGLNEQDQDSLNAATGGNLLSKTTREALKIIENKSKVRYSRSKSNVSRVNTNSRDNASKTDDKIDKLADQILNLAEIVNKQVITPAYVKTVEKTCVTCGEKFFQIFHDLHFDISFADALLLMPKFSSTIKSLLTNKDKLFELVKVPLNENCSAMLLKNFLEKLGDPSMFLIPCDFLGIDVCHALADLGASINLIPLSIWKKLSLPELTPTRMTLVLADRSITRPKGVAEDVFVKVEKFHFPIDFVVVDFQVDPRVLIILGRSFLRTGRALIDVYGEEITLRVNDESVTFNLNQTMRYSSTYDDNSVNQVDVIYIACEEFVQDVLDFQYNPKNSNHTLVFNPLNSERDSCKVSIVKSSLPTLTSFGESDFFLEEIEDFLNDESIPTGFDISLYDPEGDILYLKKLLNEDPFQLHRMDLKQAEETKAKSSIEEPLELELKELPSHLEYAFLEESNKLPVIISKDLKNVEKEALIKVLKSHKRAIAWKISDIKGIDPRFCTHKILMEEDYKPAVQSQRRVNLKFHDVIKKEVIKLLDAGMIYPISDSQWVSPIHCVPKKGGMTVVANENNELIPTRLVTGWRVCTDYKKLNDATRRDHFLLPFMDQMLERLAENELCCFLDGFSGYIQIPIDPQDQEKTTFTCPYETFAYRRMPFGLCNAPGHKILKSGIEVDRAKVDVIAKLPHPTTVKGVRSFLGHAGFYRRFIQYFSKIARPMTHLLEKETPFVFSKYCINAFNTLKKNLTEAPILVVPDWNLPFELMCDASDFAISAVLGQHKKGSENLAADHLSRLENPHKDVLENKDINGNVSLETLGSLSSNSTLWFSDIENFHAGNFIKKGLTSQQKKKFFKDKLLISSKLVMKDLLGAIMVPILQRRKAIISDHGTHFCNDQFTRVMIKYGVTHHLATVYHPQMSGQVKVSNRGLKRILERTVRENRASWSDKLDDALWAFCTTFKTPIGCTPYKLVYGKSCHLPIELEHRAYWAFKHVNFDLKTAGNHRKFQLNELNELHDQAYENFMIYKERTKKLHDSKIKNRIFNVGDQVLLFNSCLKIFSGKLKTRWSSPFTITQVFPYGTIELSQPNGPNFKMNGQRVKHYFRGDIPSKVVPDLHTIYPTMIKVSRVRCVVPGLEIKTQFQPFKSLSELIQERQLHKSLENDPVITYRYQALLTVKHLKEDKRVFRYLRQSYNMGLWYLKDSGFELISYSDADHAGSKAKYVSLSACCAQLIWMRTQLLDYGYKYNIIPMYCDSKSAIAISFNLVQHSRTKHIDIQYHFIKEHFEKGTVELYFVRTECQLAGLCTKALPKELFEYLVHRIDGLKYRLSLALDRKELTLTLDDFRTIFQLPQATGNNHEHFVIAPKFLEMEGRYYSLELPSTLIPYPRFTKLIASHYMTIFLEISRIARDKYHNLEDDMMVKNIFNSGKNKAGVVIKIPSWIITNEVKLMEHYPMYVAVFGVDVPTTQSQPITSTQGMHRTTSAPRSPNPDADKGELIKEHLIAEEIEKLVEGIENVENVKVYSSTLRQNDTQKDLNTSLELWSYKENPKGKGKNEEESRHTPSPTTIRSPRIHNTFISSDTEKLQELMVNDLLPSSSTPSSSSLKFKLFVTNRLLSLFKPKTGRFKPYKSFFDKFQGRYGYLFEHLKTRYMPRKKFNMLAQHLQEIMEDSLPKMVDSSVRNYMSGHILHVHPTQATPASAQEQQYQLYLTMRDNPQL